MKPTHQQRDSHLDATCWQFNSIDDIPAWVSREFETVMGKSFRLLHPAGLCVRQGEWVILDEEKRTLHVLTDEEFHKVYRPIPPVLVHNG